MAQGSLWKENLLGTSEVPSNNRFSCPFRLLVLAAIVPRASTSIILHESQRLCNLSPFASAFCISLLQNRFPTLALWRHVLADRTDTNPCTAPRQLLKRVNCC